MGGVEKVLGAPGGKRRREDGVFRRREQKLYMETIETPSFQSPTLCNLHKRVQGHLKDGKTSWKERRRRKMTGIIRLAPFCGSVLTCLIRLLRHCLICIRPCDLSHPSHSATRASRLPSRAWSFSLISFKPSTEA